MVLYRVCLTFGVYQIENLSGVYYCGMKTHNTPTLLLLPALICYAIAAYVIVGNLHADEHFQILEFANYKRGLVEARHLPWEFEARLRPTIQPALALVILESLSALSIRDPFLQAFLLRLLSGLFFLYSSYVLFKSLEADIRITWIRYLFMGCTFFLYLFPIIGVRFSSENWCTCFFMLGFARLHTALRSLPDKSLSVREIFLTGLLFGLSFLFRYQAAIMLFCLAVWLLVFHWREFKSWLVMFSGFAVIIVLGILIDRWFYDEWALTAWNYFNANLLQGVAASFGVEPWWWYFTKIDFSKWMVLLNSVLIGLVVLFLITEFKNPVSWIFALFVGVHLLISHKETRFLFPVLVFIPYMVARAIETLHTFLGSGRKALLLLSPIAVINGFAFVACMFRVFDNSHEIHRFIRTLPNKPVVVYYDDIRFYYALNSGQKDITPFFYKSGHEVLLRKKGDALLESLSRKSPIGDTLSYVILEWGEQAKVAGKLQPVFDPEPGFVKKVDYRNWMRLGHGRWKVYSLNKVSDSSPSDS
jgi:GPI mannosyltransferase 3